jgi:hypothetical protein
MMDSDHYNNDSYWPLVWLAFGLAVMAVLLSVGGCCRIPASFDFYHYILPLDLTPMQESTPPPGYDLANVHLSIRLTGETPS